MKLPFKVFVRLPDGTEHPVGLLSFDREGKVGRLSTCPERFLGPYYTIEGADLDQCTLITTWPEESEGRPLAATTGHGQPAPGRYPADGSSPSRPTRSRENSHHEAVDAIEIDLVMSNGTCEDCGEESAAIYRTQYSWQCVRCFADVAVEEALRKALWPEDEDDTNHTSTGFDLDALARIAINANGIVLQEGDNGTVERAKRMLEQVLAAAWSGMIVELTEARSQAKGYQVQAETILKWCEEEGIVFDISQPTLVLHNKRAERAEAERDRYRKALDEIDHTSVGACDDDFGDVEPCEQCGDMREIAERALRPEEASKC